MYLSISLIFHSGVLEAPSNLKFELTNEDRAIDILDLYSIHINPVKVLKVIPRELTMSHIDRYLERAIPYWVHKRRDGQVVKNLSRMENLQTKSQLIKVKSKSVVIQPNTRCPVCMKRIGDTIFSLPPGADAVPVHYNCQAKYMESKKKPSRKTREVAHYS